jgi:hypothetical protein
LVLFGSCPVDPDGLLALCNRAMADHLYDAEPTIVSPAHIFAGPPSGLVRVLTGIEYCFGTISEVTVDSIHPRFSLAIIAVAIVVRGIVSMIVVRSIVLIPYHRWGNIHRTGFHIGIARSVYGTTTEHNQRSYRDCCMQ